MWPITRSTPAARQGQPQTKKRKCRYPTRESELVHRRLQVPSSPLHDPSSTQLRAGPRGDDSLRASCLTWDIRAQFRGLHDVTDRMHGLLIERADGRWVELRVEKADQRDWKHGAQTDGQ